jgi:hypothetical protein
MFKRNELFEGVPRLSMMWAHTLEDVTQALQSPIYVRARRQLHTPNNTGGVLIDARGAVLANSYKASTVKRVSRDDFKRFTVARRMDAIEFLCMGNLLLAFHSFESAGAFIDYDDEDRARRNARHLRPLAQFDECGWYSTAFDTLVALKELRL